MRPSGFEDRDDHRTACASAVGGGFLWPVTRTTSAAPPQADYRLKSSSRRNILSDLWSSKTGVGMITSHREAIAPWPVQCGPIKISLMSAAAQNLTTVRLSMVQVDVFTDRALTGNPLAVFPHGPGLTTDHIHSPAREPHLSATTFILPGEAAVDSPAGV